MVYVPQEVMRRDTVTGEMRPQFDLRKLLEFGEPVICLPGGRVGFSPAPTVHALRDKLRNFCNDDYLVAIGDPSAIAIASAIACDNNMGRMNLLKWDKEARTYIKVAIDLYPERRNRYDD